MSGQGETRPRGAPGPGPRRAMNPSEPLYDAVLPAPFGALGVQLRHGALARLDILPPDAVARDGAEPGVQRVAAELAAYFADPRHAFDLPLALAGSPFRLAVWQALRQIPAGRTRSYGELARGLASSPRAVGQAAGDNPVPIVVPCHRVVAAHGGLGGFMHGRGGFPMEVKRWLLAHEGVL
jgi:methylated-DNA-[protein]-cysteine S-methyltransferase